MAKITRYLREVVQARRMTASAWDFTKLVWYTGLFHLGNKLAAANSDSPRRIWCQCNGRRVMVHFRQNVGDVAVLHEVLGASIYGAPYDSLGPIRTIVDLGAHIGLATLFFATRYPMAKVFSVEPAPENFELLKANCVDNAVNATLVNKCIGPRTAEVDLYRSPASHMHTLLQPSSRGTGESSPIAMLAMQDLVSDNHIDEIDILKVDIEGGEGELFAQCDQWISRVRVIVIEIHPQLVDYAEVIHTITSRGFEYFPPGTLALHYDVFVRRAPSQYR